MLSTSGLKKETHSYFLNKLKFKKNKTTEKMTKSLTCEIDKKTKLKLKRKLSIIIKLNYCNFFVNSPARLQFSHALFTRDKKIVLYPFHFVNDTICSNMIIPLNDNVSMILNEVSRTSDVTNRYFSHTTSGFIDIQGTDNENYQFYCIKKKMVVLDQKVSLLIQLRKKVDVSYYPMNNDDLREIKIQYNMKSNRLNVSTTIENANPEDIVKMINEMIFQSLMF